MDSLKQLNFKSVYRTGADDLYNDFYAPALSVSVQYDRAVGFFSSEILSMSLKGLSRLVSSNGRMRLVIGHPLDVDEFNAIKQGLLFKEVVQDLSQKLEAMLSEPDPKVERLELLSWLIACNRLEIKFALRKVGMYHEKIGIFTDAFGDRIVFHGSANETPHGMLSTLNAESISVFKSWDSQVFEAYGAEYEKGFERLWNNTEEHTITIDVPSESYERISASALYKREKIELLINFENELSIREQNSGGNLIPTIPNSLGGNPFSIRSHQRAALASWKQASYRGILKLATGSGKTITSIYGAVKIFEARQMQRQPLMLLIAVPYVELALQWVSNLEDFNIHAHQCFDSKSNWYDALSNQITYFNAGVTPFIAVVVVNKTLKSKTFQELIHKVPSNSLMFVGDECHNHGSQNINEALPNAAYRMGLSATPFRSDDDELDSPFPDDARHRLIEYYGDVVAEYGLDDAIHDGVLTPYEYHIIIVQLTIEEQEQFDELSSKIQKLLLKLRGAGLSADERDAFTRYCGQRSRLLGSAKNKLVKLKELTAGLSKEERVHTLFYSGEGKPFSIDEPDDNKVIDKISKILDQNGWRASQFTSSSGRKQRQSIMQAFKEKTIEALVAMKVLDEGIDVPSCKTAYILASTKNPRQYVQRRGRILRKAPGKNLAKIYDFVVLPANDSLAGKSLKKAEALRINDFALLAVNKLEIEKIIEDQGLTYDEY